MSRRLNVKFMKKYMQDKGHSEIKYASIIGVSPSMLNRVLNGKREAGKKVIFGILSADSELNIEKILS